MDESFVGQNITCPSCSKEFFATPPKPAPVESAPAPSPQPPHLSLFDKLPVFKGHRRKLLEAKFDEVLQAGPIDAAAELALVSYATSLNLEPSDFTEIRQHRFAAEYEPVKLGVEASMWLTDEDIEAQHRLEQKYGIQVKLTGEAELCRDIYLVESKGQLPAPIGTDLMLDPKESTYYYVATTWHQSRVSSRGYSGTSVSLPSGIKGVRFRFGGYTPIKSEAMTPLASGLLYVTSKRLLFNGDRRNTTINLSKIIDGHVYANALRIEKSAGKPDLFSMIPAQGRYILALLDKLK